MSNVTDVPKTPDTRGANLAFEAVAVLTTQPGLATAQSNAACG
jgi:hypothetical protein